MDRKRKTENFPVGSFLIPKRLRPDVHVYYRFARLADDIADHPELSKDTKVERLNAMEAALDSAQTSLERVYQEAACDLGNRLRNRNLDLRLASDLLDAFRWDAENKTCRTWGDLINYCRFSACPVGRFLLCLHGEKEGHEESDALCSALQILNHLQDAKTDYLTLQRCYLPMDWLGHDGAGKTDLLQSASGKELRLTFNRVLDQTETLLTRAQDLSRRIQHRGLAAEAVVCLSLARLLGRKLRHNDPVARQVRLSKTDWVKAAGPGLWRFCFS